MNNNHITQPTDRQLTDYISHMASSEDTAVVEAWLAADPANVDELLTITVAAALPSAKASKTIAFTPWYRRPVYWAAAASLALVLVTAALFWQHNATPDTPPMVAVAGPGQVPESLTIAVQEKVADAQEQTVPVQEQTLPLREQPAEGLIIQRAERVTASQAVSAAPMLEVTTPRRQREVYPAGQDIVFRFKSNAAQLTLALTDAEGTVILRAEVTGQESYTFPASRIGDNSVIQWSLTASFAEGQSQRRTGAIELMN